MKKIYFILITIILCIFLLTGCGGTEEYSSIITKVNKNILYVYNCDGISNNDNWNKIDIYKDVDKDSVKVISKMDFKIGDLIKFKGSSFGGWSNISSIEIISRENTIPNNN